MAEYEEGTVAVATVRGVPGVRVFLTARDRGGSGRFSVWRHAEVKGEHVSHPKDLADIRPLVVLDPEKFSTFGTATVVEYLRSGDGDLLRRLDKTLPYIADQIEAQTKPPRIPEPGRWGVVLATYDGVGEGGREEFVRFGDVWESQGFSEIRWDELKDPVLVRPGVDD